MPTDHVPLFAKAIRQRWIEISYKTTPHEVKCGVVLLASKAWLRQS